LCGQYESVQSPHDLPPAVRAQIEHFFGHYKNREAGKRVKVQREEATAAAMAEIGQSIERYRLAPEKPAF
jgi:inorganic pyrophosphatase